MPIPLIALGAAALAGRATKKPKRVKPVSGYKKKNGTRVKAYLKKEK